MKHRWSERVFHALLALYPSAFRERFGRDMTELFRDRVQAARTRGGTIAELRVLFRSVSDTLHAATAERRAQRARHRRYARLTSHHRRGDPTMKIILSDLRFAGRMLRKSPAFAGIAVLVIALGTGAVSTIYTTMNSLLLRPIPGAARAEELVSFAVIRADGQRNMTSSLEWFDLLRQRATSLSAVAGWNKLSLTVGAPTERVVANGNIVTGNYFEMLGTRASLGRFFSTSEERQATPVAVLSSGFWQRVFGGDSSVIGRSLTINGSAFTVIGVTEPSFLGAMTVTPVDVWVPLSTEVLLRPYRDRASGVWLRVVGRLREGRTLEAAQTEATEVTAQYESARTAPSTNALARAEAYPLRGIPEDARGSFLGFLGLMLGAALLVLLIASVNIATMLSARAVARRREMAVRTALGANRGRLLRQLLTETAVLFALGATGGLAIAIGSAAWIRQLRIPIDAALSLNVAPDYRVFLVSLAVALTSGLIFGLVPALEASRTDVTTRLRDGTAGSGSRRGFLLNALIVGQLALSLLLLVGAGLFIRALDRGNRVDPGFSARDVYTTRIDPGSWGYDSLRSATLFARIQEALEGTPGIQALSYADHLPLAMANSSTQVRMVGSAVAGAGAENQRVDVAYVDDGYFSALQLPVVDGRAIATPDRVQGARVAVVNETFAKKHWPTSSAVGQTLLNGDDPVVIVGVARDAKYETLHESPRPFLYLPIWTLNGRNRALVVRATGAEEVIRQQIRSVVERIDPSAPVPTITPLSEVNRLVLLPQRIAAYVTGILGLIGLLLASVGLFGVMSYSTSGRTREIGLRVALGASKGDIVRLIVRESARLSITGIGIGLLLALAASKAIGAFLFTGSAFDPIAFGSMAALFGVVVFVAAWLPARRAGRADPMVALKSD